MTTYNLVKEQFVVLKNTKLIMRKIIV